MGVTVDVLKENIRPNARDIVKVTSCGYETLITYSTHRSHGGVTQKINKDFYVDKRNGEVKEFHHNEKRIDDTKSVARSIKNIRDTINANITDPKKCKFITLTYAGNMTDTKKVYNDFGNFYKKKLKKAYPEIDKYIAVLEPQARGAWHLHLILIFFGQAPFIDNKIIADMWGHGFTNTRKLDNCDNIGAYLSAYLGDLPIDEAEAIGMETEYAPYKTVEMIDEQGNKIPKKVIKGGRLHFYPKGVQIMRHSNNCAKPSIRYCTNEEAEFQVAFDELTYEVTKSITDTETGFQNTTNYRSYNMIR